MATRGHFYKECRFSWQLGRVFMPCMLGHRLYKTFVIVEQYYLFVVVILGGDEPPEGQQRSV